MPTPLALLSAPTPVVRIGELNANGGAEVLAKLEFARPTGGAKDRVALAMVEDAERRGLIRPGALVVEAASDDLGTALAASSPPPAARASS